MSNAPTNEDRDEMPEVDFARPDLKRITRRHKGRERISLGLARVALGKTQAEVAAASGLGQGDISRLERRDDALVSTLRRYAAALGCALEVTVVFPDGARAPLALGEGDATARRSPIPSRSKARRSA